VAITLLTQWGLLTWTHRVQAHIRGSLMSDYEIDLKNEPPPEPPKEEEKPQEPMPAPTPQAKPVAQQQPALAEAAHVLTSNPDPNKVEDMTNTIVDGNGAGGGGLSGANGQNQGFGTGTNIAPTPSGGGTAPAPPPPPPPPAPTVDKTRAAGLRGSSDWRCPWPAEADAAQVDEAYVTVSVIVRPDGSAQTVNVLNDPGFGFGRAARGCAMREKYTPALDREGAPVGGQTKAFRIHFSR
jgi:protein TonB